MSFYSFKNEGNLQTPGRIGEEGLSRICERVCIQVNKVYDSCLQQESLSTQVRLEQVRGEPFVNPLVFTGCESKTTKGILCNVSIDRLTDRPRFARVRADVKIPVEVTFMDQRGREGSGVAFITVHKDVIMFVPDNSVIPFRLESVVSAHCVDGSVINSENFVFTIDVCFTIILKIVATVELLIPAFGFCEVPPCEEFAENVCDEFFRLPLFPPQLEDCC